MKQTSLLLKTSAELIGTFFIVFLGCGAIRLGLPPWLVSVIFGLSVTAMIYTLGHISGAHFNPAVTLGFTTAKRFPRSQIGPYWMAQLTGAFLAIIFLSSIPSSAGYGAVTTHVIPWQTFAWETVLTFFLMLVIIAVATSPGASKILIASSIGGIVLIGSFIGGPVTGAAMNPARYVAPALAEGKWEWWWAYLAGAFIGACLAAVFYEKIRPKI